MNFFELALYGVCGANLGAKRATYASLGVYIGLLAHAGEKVLNGLRRAHRGTKSTVRAKAIIYACNIVFNGDALLRTFFGAESASYARLCTSTHFACIGASII